MQHSLEKDEEEEDCMISHMSQKMLTGKKKNLVADKCESNVFYYI